MEHHRLQHVSRRGLVFGASLSAGAWALPAPSYAGGVRVRRTTLSQGKVIYLLPPNHRPGKKLPLVIFHHGAGTRAKASLRSPSTNRVLRHLAANGYCVAVSDFGGSLWGNDRNHDYIIKLITATQRDLARGGPVTLVGSSMGGGAVLSFAGRYPGRVRSVVAMQPTLDLRDLSTRGFRIDKRYSGGYSDRRYGAEHSPVVQAAVRQGGRRGQRSFDGVPIRLYYGTEDRVITPEVVEEFARRVSRGKKPRLHLRPLANTGHGDVLIRRVPLNDLVGFIKKHHPPRRG